MFDVYSGDWPVAMSSSDPRNQFHEHALQEARTVTDHRAVEPPTRPQPGFVTRLRLVFAGEPARASAEPCSCPA